MARKYFKKNQTFGDWKLLEYLGGGGNGEVWKCEDKSGNIGAIKLIKSIKQKSYDRFKDEITITEKNSDLDGIIPIIDKNLPKVLKSGNHPYFVMPVAESAENQLKGKSLEEKIDAVLEIAHTLKELHRRKISHRDLKLPNILIYNSRYCVADFGLVDFPNKKDISVRNEQIGAKWTIAPEMKRTSSTANSLKADIYSLAKTLWIILTENSKGFDGQYSTESIIELKNFYKSDYTSPIDKLLTQSTDNDPENRPTIDEFINALLEWKNLNDDFHERNLAQWFEIQTKLFPTSFPKRVIWEKVEDIIQVLKIISSYDNLNHMFFPDGGGLDLVDAKLGNERGCIDLNFSGIFDLVKPKRLVFESFGSNADWNYFRLELDKLEPSHVHLENGVLPDIFKEMMRETVSEITPGNYDKYDIVEHRYIYEEDGYEIPKEARHISRWFEGCFVIFSKRSHYNLTPSTYDGRHNKMDTEEFRNYIENWIDRTS
ncbi:protein kinase domain-containing protein [Salegentibacter maritimus]|uniref:protein kinase domain-containing protein n=1 Tax=Salegentibacter maritimus TaxID=2794347 RepID=UPI0018E4279E|nr:protein kinase [Salegentibacter maritimus]MBI6118333.1 protein kinase [Salegentibacter maritimus]